MVFWFCYISSSNRALTTLDFQLYHCRVQPVVAISTIFIREREKEGYFSSSVHQPTGSLVFGDSFGVPFPVAAVSISSWILTCSRLHFLDRKAQLERSLRTGAGHNIFYLVTATVRPQYVWVQTIMQRSYKTTSFTFLRLQHLLLLQKVWGRRKYSYCYCLVLHFFFSSKAWGEKMLGRD